MDIITLALAKKNTAKQIANLQNIGRALSLWDCVTGKPVSNPPSGVPYTYKTGDYYRVSSIADGTFTHSVHFTGTDLNDNAFDIVFSFQNEDYDQAITDNVSLVSALMQVGYDSNFLEATGTVGTHTVTKLKADGSIKLYSGDEQVGNVGTICTTTIQDIVSGTLYNYRPTGASYTGAASTTIEYELVNTDSIYFYDGTSWLLKKDGTLPYTVTVIS